MARSAAKVAVPEKPVPSRNGARNLPLAIEQDPLLSAIGLGKDLWPGRSGDAYVEELQQGWDDE